uniref:ATP synthase complex subunit 8 n=1 Tax=Blanus cinereus TaxID=227091 RepID=B7SN14_BLACI|nr:ATP synthase F0 subunit 8 [Blanus cinereus]ABZ79344.1 ATP synthase F0 subunit 8 [Blanus cinereus]
MPQLNPAPWFILLLLVWTTLLVYVTKTTNIMVSLTPALPHAAASRGTFWPWPWL